MTRVILDDGTRPMTMRGVTPPGVNMNQTSLSLLDRVRRSSDGDAWGRLVAIYSPLLKGWLARYDVPANDADDLVQEVLLAVSKEVDAFEHNGREGAFRAWLKTILINRMRNYWRARDRRPAARGDSDHQRQLNALEDPASDMSALWNREHDRHVSQQLMLEAERHFAPTTWQAFCRVALDGEKADVVAAELDLSLNAVFIAKSRVLRHLRQQAAGLIDASSDFSRIR